MQLPTRKIRTLVQYAGIFSCLSLVIYTIHSFQSKTLPVKRFVKISTANGGIYLPYINGT